MPYVKVGREESDVWPPDDKETVERMKRYFEARMLFRGKHEEVYERVQRWLEEQTDKSVTYIICNFAGLISKVAADMLFGESPKFIASSDPGSREQEQLNRLIEQNGMHTLNYEMALSASWRGEVVYKVRYGQKPGWIDGHAGAIIEAVSPGRFWPHLAEDNIRELHGATFGWLKRKGERAYLRLELQRPGEIENQLWLLGDDERTVKERVKLNVLEEYRDLEEVQETGYPGMLFHFTPNWRLEDEFWGISDYSDMGSLFDELNNRVSRISRVLDKHESPRLIIPPGMMKWDDRTGRWYIEKEDLEAIEVNPEEGQDVGNLPRYLTWDAQLGAAFQQIDKLMEMAFLMSETSPDAFGLGKSGVAESGRALKFRLLRLLAKINRKKLYFNETLRAVINTALYLEAVHGDGVDPDQIDLRTEWKDGIPDDPMEMAQVENIRTGSKATSSRRSSIRRLDDLEGAELEEELQAIDDDEVGEGAGAGLGLFGTPRSTILPGSEDVIEGRGEPGAEE